MKIRCVGRRDRRPNPWVTFSACRQLTQFSKRHAQQGTVGSPQVSLSIERDLGAVVELAAGLSPNDRVIQNPLDGIATGTEVRLAEAAPGAAPAGKAKKANERG